VPIPLRVSSKDGLRQMNDIGKIELVFLLVLLFIVVFGLIARRLGTPYPIVMVIGGLLLGFVPGIPDIALNPDVVFLVVLPPLLYAAAWTTSSPALTGASASCSAPSWPQQTPLLPLPSPGGSGYRAESWTFSKEKASSTMLPACSLFNSPQPSWSTSKYRLCPPAS